MNGKVVRILNGAMDEHDGRIVLRGVLDPQSLEHLMTDKYQRDVRPVTSLKKIMQGFDTGSAIPDIELGMRGAKRRHRDGIYELQDDVYIIDGLQRVSAARLYKSGGKLPHLGASIHFNTDETWERKQFKILNSDRTGVNSNVIFRNLGEDYDSIKSLITMSRDDREFVAREKIAWGQTMQKGELITSSAFIKTVLVLHDRSFSGKPEDVAIRLEEVTKVFGKNIVRANVREFYSNIDQAWPLRNIAYKNKTPFLRAVFLITLARVMSNHDNFWPNENKLFMDADFRRKLGQFPIFDPSVLNLVSGGAKIDPELYRQIVEHLNKGRTKRRLRERCSVIVKKEDKVQDHQDDAGEEAA